LVFGICVLKFKVITDEIKILELSKYISPVNGGFGCVRDVIEKVLRVQDKWVFHDDVVPNKYQNAIFKFQIN
jgi:3-deoxy-D-manno-octulosonate 8-phosphate phosphatase KdsC-like HAD superfamily phosphatase